MFGLFGKKKQGNRGEGAAHRTPRFIRGFAAAEVSRTLSAWMFDGGFSNAEIAAQLATIRSRSRERQKNDEYFCNYFRSFKINVVGSGFTFKAQPSLIAGEPEVDTDAKKFLQYHFWKWSKNRRECDLAGRHNLAAIFRLMAVNWARDGEAIAIIERNAPTVYGIQLRVVRPDALDETLNARGTSAATIIRNGVEIERTTRRAVAYWFRTNREYPTAVYIYGSQPVMRVPASDVIHCFSTEDAAQTRGIPLTHASLKKGKMLDDFNQSELVAALDETNTIGTFKDKSGRDPASAGIGADDEGYTDEEKAAYTQKSEPGTKMWLDGDIDFAWHSPNHPNREVTAFKKTTIRDIACGLGVDYPVFANDLGETNFSSIRAGTIAMRDNWKMLQDDFIDQVVTPVYEAWLASFLARPIANPYVPSDYARLVEHEFKGRTWAWVDPLKDIYASRIAVEQGWKTNEEITSEYGGADFLENCDQLKIENEAKVAAGLSKAPTSQPSGGNGGNDGGNNNQGDKK